MREQSPWNSTSGCPSTHSPASAKKNPTAFVFLCTRATAQFSLRLGTGRIYSDASHPLLFKKLQILNTPRFPTQVIFDGEYVAPDELHIFDVLECRRTRSCQNEFVRAEEDSVAASLGSQKVSRSALGAREFRRRKYSNTKKMNCRKDMKELL